MQLIRETSQPVWLCYIIYSGGLIRRYVCEHDIRSSQRNYLVGYGRSNVDQKTWVWTHLGGQGTEETFSGEFIPRVFRRDGC